MTVTVERPRLTPEQAADIRNRVQATEEGRDPIGDGKALQQVRQKADLSQAQLAAAVGLSVAVIKNIESGRSKFRGLLREALWRAVVDALQAKYMREKALREMLAEGRTKEELAAENAMLAQRVSQLEETVTNLSSQLAEHIDAVRPALEKLEKAAAEQGAHILTKSSLGKRKRKG